MGEAAPKNTSMSSLSHKDNYPSKDDEPPLPIQLQKHHYISPGVLYKIQLSTWLSENQDDPTLKVRLYYQSIRQFWSTFQNFLPHLKEHLLGRLLRHDYDGDEHSFTIQEQIRLTFLHNWIYKHNTFHVNYTIYDLHHAQDTLNPRTHANFITLSHKDDEELETRFPYWFGWIVGIFHAVVVYIGPGSCSVNP